MPDDNDEAVGRFLLTAVDRFRADRAALQRDLTQKLTEAHELDTQEKPDDEDA